jgi:hypothetical protein
MPPGDRRPGRRRKYHCILRLMPFIADLPARRTKAACNKAPVAL